MPNACHRSGPRAALGFTGAPLSSELPMDDRTQATNPVKLLSNEYGADKKGRSVARPRLSTTFSPIRSERNNSTWLSIIGSSCVELPLSVNFVTTDGWFLSIRILAVDSYKGTSAARYAAPAQGLRARM
ncbi:hypothetical protein AJ88_12805 [Mesorhizobium amorphae CCBAU 01583]|nr:hypothetical protein AJ88_12805 [Mesorhizobium amorphae CCBAU 01583]